MIDSLVPFLSIRINMQEFDTKLFKVQFNQLLALGEHFQAYLSLSDLEKNKTKYKWVRPYKDFRYMKKGTAERQKCVKEWLTYAKTVTMFRIKDSKKKLHPNFMTKECQDLYQATF